MLHLLERTCQPLPRSPESPLLWTSGLPDSLLIGENGEKEVLRGRGPHPASRGPRDPCPANSSTAHPPRSCSRGAAPQDWGLTRPTRPQGGKTGRAGGRAGPGADLGSLGTPRRGTQVLLRVTERVLFCGNGTRERGSYELALEMGWGRPETPHQEASDVSVPRWQ